MKYTDLLRSDTGLAVRYDLVELEHKVGPYEAGAHWADPDIQQASELMRWVFEHREEAAALGRRAGEESSVFSTRSASISASFFPISSASFSFRPRIAASARPSASIIVMCRSSSPTRKTVMKS